MFTGLVEGIGRVLEARKVLGEMDLEVDVGTETTLIEVGASIAISGVCCTVTAVDGQRARFRLSAETLARTWFSTLAAGDRLNVEGALCAGEPLGGHIVQGHVDGVARIVAGIDPHAGGELAIELPPELERYCVEKGSIAVDGVSLTIAAIVETRASFAIIPHTATATTLGELPASRLVNVEVDILAKYVEKLLDR